MRMRQCVHAHPKLSAGKNNDAVSVRLGGTDSFNPQFSTHSVPVALTFHPQQCSSVVNPSQLQTKAPAPRKQIV